MDEEVGEADFISNLVITPNPSGYAPLTAEVSFLTSRAVHVEVVVEGLEGGEDVVGRFDYQHDQVTLPILGLYPSTHNRVILRFISGSNTLIAQNELMIEAPDIISDLPRIDFEVLRQSAIKPGMNLVSYFGHNSEFTPQRPFMFDSQGVIRWYLDFREHPSLSSLFFDDGVERLANGNLLFGDGSTDRIIEMDMLGRIVDTWSMPGFGFHHLVIEKPGGNFIATVNKQGSSTVEDHIIEIGRTSHTIVREWDLRQSLQYGRRAWPANFGDQDVDWFHANGVVYDPSDDTIIVSGRTQGTIKLSMDNEVVWIVAPHRGWSTSGNGVDLNSKLLQPLGADGEAILDEDVLDGRSNHPDFEWAWYQHAPELMPDGSLLLFDNGDNRNYSSSERYSRAVQFRIDESAGTIEQVWQYGKDRGEETFSRIVSDVDYHADKDNIVFMPGAIVSGAAPNGKMIEIDYSTGEVLFEATITPPIAAFDLITFHRVERLEIYPPR